MNNNPVRYNDPTGHCVPGMSIVCGAIIGGLVGGVVSYARQVSMNVKQNGLSASAFTTNIDTVDIGASMLVGAAAGALIGSGVGASAGIGLIANGAGMGMASSALGYTVAAGGDYKTSDMVVTSIIGGVAGGLSAGWSKGISDFYKYSNGGEFFSAAGNGVISAGAGLLQSAATGGNAEVNIAVGGAGGILAFSVELFFDPLPRWLKTPLVNFARSTTSEVIVNETLDCDGTWDFCSSR